MRMLHLPPLLSIDGGRGDGRMVLSLTLPPLCSSPCPPAGRHHASAAPPTLSPHRELPRPAPPYDSIPPQGVNMQDRKRIFAWFAHRGLPRRGSPGAHLHPSTHSVAYRLRLLALLCGWTSWCFLSAAAGRSWGMVMHLFGPVMFDDL